MHIPYNKGCCRAVDVSDPPNAMSPFPAESFLQDGVRAEDPNVTGRSAHLYTLFERLELCLAHVFRYFLIGFTDTFPVSDGLQCKVSVRAPLSLKYSTRLG